MEGRISLKIVLIFFRETKKKVSPKKKKDENLQDILKRLRANSSQKIINANDVKS